MTVVKRTGLDSASMFPVGATIQATTWHLAGDYGPSFEEYPTERDALVAGIEAVQSRADRYLAVHGAEYVERRPYTAERVTIDLRWKMTWSQGAPDANGYPTYSCGSNFTISRTSYESLAEAREHLARIDKYAPNGAPV